MATKGKDKNRQIVIMTLFAMTCVVIGHSDIDESFTELWIFRWVYTFHMPLFFFISGFLFCLTMPAVKLCDTSFLTFMKKKVVRLLIPFLFINTVIFLIKANVISDTSMMKNPVEMTWHSFLDATLYHPIGFMWFLPALFMVFVYSFPIWKGLKNLSKESRGSHIPLIIFVLVVFFWLAYLLLPHTALMQASRAFNYVTFFLLGILYCEYKPIVDGFLKRYWLISGTIAFAFSASLMLPEIPAALCGIVFSVAFSLVLEDKCPDRFVDASSFCYTVFLLSYFPQMFIRGPVAHQFTGVNPTLLSAISFVSGLLLPICFGMIFVRLRNKHKSVGRLGILIGL